MLSPLTPAEFYDKYASIIYGGICRVANDKPTAEKIFAAFFIIELNGPPADVKENALFTARLLRRVYNFTTDALNRDGIIRDSINARQHVTVLDFLCSKHTSVKETSHCLSITEAEVRKSLRNDLLKFRVKKDSLVNKRA